MQLIELRVRKVEGKVVDRKCPGLQSKVWAKEVRMLASRLMVLMTIKQIMVRTASIFRVAWDWVCNRRATGLLFWIWLRIVKGWRTLLPNWGSMTSLAIHSLSIWADKHQNSSWKRMKTWIWQITRYFWVSSSNTQPIYLISETTCCSSPKKRQLMKL